MASTIITAALKAPPGYYPRVPNQGDTVDTEFSPTYFNQLAAYQVSRDRSACLSPDTHFLWRGLTVPYSDGPFSVRFVDTEGYFTSNALVPSSFLIGDPGCPFSLEPGILIPPGGRIAVEILDTSGSTNNIQLQFRGVKRFQLTGKIEAVPITQAAKYQPLPFWYLFNLPTLSGNQTINPLVLGLDQDADFVYQTLQFSATGAFNLQMQDGQDHWLSSGYTPSAALLSTPSNPYLFDPPITTPSGGQIVLNIQDTSGNTNNISLLFKGYKNYQVVAG